MATAGPELSDHTGATPVPFWLDALVVTSAVWLGLVVVMCVDWYRQGSYPEWSRALYYLRSATLTACTEGVLISLLNRRHGKGDLRLFWLVLIAAVFEEGLFILWVGVLHPGDVFAPRMALFSPTLAVSSTDCILAWLSERFLNGRLLLRIAGDAGGLGLAVLLRGRWAEGLALKGPGALLTVCFSGPLLSYSSASHGCNVLVVALAVPLLRLVGNRVPLQHIAARD